MARDSKSKRASKNNDAVNHFHATESGIFLERDGRARKISTTYTNKKLCFVATDQQFLAETLLKLSRRRDCYYVKLSTKSKDGMFLGRCFMLDEVVVGSLWWRFKRHPKLMCSVQDDSFAFQFRPSQRSNRRGGKRVASVVKSRRR